MRRMKVSGPAGFTAVGDVVVEIRGRFGQYRSEPISLVDGDTLTVDNDCELVSLTGNLDDVRGDVTTTIEEE